MSVQHAITTTWAGNGGAGTIQRAVTLTGAVEQNVDTQVPGDSSISPTLDFTLSKLQDVYIVCDQNVTLYTNGTQQVSTATVVAGSGITGNGNASVIVTSAILPGSPVTYSVPVTTALTTAAEIAAAMRTYLQGQSALTALFAVGGTGATVKLTALAPAANDSTLNIETENGSCTGITTEASSSATTAGAAPQDTLVLSAGEPCAWYTGSAVTAPFAGSVTSVIIANYGATAANLSIRTLESL